MAYIDQFFEVLINAGASDLHLGEGQPPKIRRHGEIVPIRNEALDARRDGLHDERDLRAGSLEALRARQAISTSPTRWMSTRGFAAISSSKRTATARFPADPDEDHVRSTSSAFRRSSRNSATCAAALVLVTGPTGSGKSTTLAALLDYINTNFPRHIITVEEPIEFVHSNKRSIITQREVPEHATSFPIGLKAALREDADIVLVGEMRDLETIQLALTAAETGLLVFGTLHTNNARKTVDRMIDVFPSDQQAQVRTMLANSLRGVVAQLLLKRSDGGGRLAVNEILVVNSAAAAIIREGATQKLQDVIVGGKGQGMQFMDDAIWSVMQQGIVTPHEAYMKAIDKNRFRPFLPPEDAGLL